MKNFLKNLALFALILSIASPVFAQKKWKKNKDGTVDIELWYGAAVTEAGPPPTDWVAYDIIREKLGINLILTALPSSETDQDTKINAAGAANNLPDLFMCGDNCFQILVKQKLLAPVDKLFDKMPNRSAKLYDKDARLQSTINGVCYGFSQPGTIVRNEGVVIREDWLKKLGLAVPKTTDEFFEVMKAFTFKDPDGNGRNDTYGLGAYIELKPMCEGLGARFDPWFGAFGVAGTWNMTRAGAGLNINKPEYYDALVFLKKIIDEKVIDPNWTAYKKDDYRASWKQGKFGIFREQNAALHAENNYAPFDQNFPKGELVVIDPPMGPTGKQSAGVYDQSYRRYCIAAANAKQVIKGWKDVDGTKKDITKEDMIVRLLEWMSSDEGYYLLGYGVEGVNWIRDPKTGAPTKDGLPDPQKAYSKPKMQPLTQLRNMVYYNSNEELAARYPTYITATSKKEMSALKTLRIMQSKPWTPVIGASMLPLPDADLQRFYEQGVVEFMTGKRQLTKANWDAWLAEFNKMGGSAWEKAGIAKMKEMNLLR